MLAELWCVSPDPLSICTVRGYGKNGTWEVKWGPGVLSLETNAAVRVVLCFF